MNITMNKKIDDNNMIKVYKLLAILCVFNIGDYLTTVLALKNNRVIEGNYIARYFVESGNLHWFKIVGVSLLCVYLIWRAKNDIKSQLRITKLLKWTNVAYGLIIISNIITYNVW